MIIQSPTRIVSGMRSTGALHLGHLHGVLNNWLHLQNSYECFFFVADLHALTTHYADPQGIQQYIRDIVIDWLAVGIDSDVSHLFVQSHLPEHAELHLLLSMITPLSWLERVPTYKDQQIKLNDKDLSTYGFLGYPLLQAADILLYKANKVPVGEDQVVHVELVREIARRFNHFYGQQDDDDAMPLQSLKKTDQETFLTMVKAYQEQGDEDALKRGRELIASLSHFSQSETESLLGYLEGKGRLILSEPEPLLTQLPVVPGLDGQKMSKSYHNTIGLRDDTETVDKKIRTMPTDPARIRRSDPGDPEKCPVWKFHQMYSDEETKAWVQSGCRSAGIGCIECKKKISEAINQELDPIREKVIHFMQKPKLVEDVLHAGEQAAKKVASETLREVKTVMGL